ncbi:MAG: hypothetical protein JXR97_06195, partial [Planctomycetes bacterium]|nr:hypothetical protein [Planctomycetota bacterium]
LDAQGKGLNLTLSEDPMLLFFDSADLKLADKLEKPTISLVGAIPTIVKGGEVKLTFNIGNEPVENLSLTAPMGWNVGPMKVEEQGIGFLTVTCPERTDARVGMLTLQSKSKGGELSLPLPVIGKIALRVVPEPITNGKGGLHVEIINNGITPEKVSYDISMPEEIEMEKGTFHKSHARPFTPKFEGETKGEAVVDAGSRKVIVLPVGNLDYKCIYKARVTVVNASGERVESERFVSGFAGVPKVAAPLTLDIAKDEKEWAKAMPLTINEEKQYYWLRKTDNEVGSWDGPEDLSGTIRFLWDDQYLYLRADIVDDIYLHAKKNGSLWAMDGLQMLIDPARESSEKSGYYDISMGDGSKGNQAWCHSSAHPSVLAGEAKGIILKSFPSTTSKGGRIQVAAIPWAHIAPFKPVAGNNLGICVIFNEDDGPGRGSFMGWFGCAHSKQLDLVGDLILQ